jgi:hypothetical protein
LSVNVKMNITTETLITKYFKLLHKQSISRNPCTWYYQWCVSTFSYRLCKREPHSSFIAIRLVSYQILWGPLLFKTHDDVRVVNTHIAYSEAHLMEEKNGRSIISQTYYVYSSEKNFNFHIWIHVYCMLLHDWKLKAQKNYI